MKSTDRLNKLKDLSTEELNDRSEEMSEEAFRLRFQSTMGQTEALKKMRELRRDRARVLTLLRQKRVVDQQKSD
jgi:large subunit ribosomal protein L29